MTKRSQWQDKIDADPEHSQRYAQRWRDIAASGQDIVGEARLVDAMVPRGARVLDAGCGSGRIGGYLAAQNHQVVGVDLDPHLIDVARADHPSARWFVGDLAELDLHAQGFDGFDAIVCAGNVMTFLHPDTRREVLRRLALHLAPAEGDTPAGRLVVGFGRGRGYEFQDYLDDCAHAGLEVQVGLSTWDLRPFDADSDFLVTVLGRA
ncbi:class I SAM-dependent methyltransferase [Mariniluteicoccus endophyticus]